MDAAEIRYRLTGEPHAEYYRREMRKHKGLLHRVLKRLAGLGEDAGLVTDEFYKQIGV